MAESSFDVVSSVDLQEVKNAISQAMKEITTRFDLKGTGSDIALQGEEIVITSADNAASRRVAEKRGFRHDGAPREDPTGVLLRWEVPGRC